MIDNVLLLSIITISSGVIGLIIRYVFKSKCTNINFCFGCLKVERNVEAELTEQRIEMRNVQNENNENII